VQPGHLLEIEEGVTLFDTDLRLVAWNEEFAELCLLPTAELRVGLSVEQLYEFALEQGVFTPDWEPQARTRARELREGSAPTSEDVPFADGRTVEIRRYFLPGFGLAAVFTDVTERRAEEARRLRGENLATLGRVAGGLAHDFNNLLTVITGSLELALRSEGAGAVRECVETSLRAAWRGAELTRTALGLAKNQSPVIETVRASDAVEEIVRFAQRVLPESIAIHVERQSDAPLRVDRSGLSAALLNLFLNARDAMPRGGDLTVAVTDEAADGESLVRIAVSDTGVGMSPTTLAQVSRPLFSTKPPGEGTGLGLYEVSRFAAGCGGRVEIRSVEGEGSRISLLLPHAGAHVVADEPAATQTRAAGARLLVVEDDADVRLAIRRALERAGWRVTEASDADAALKCLERGSYAGLVTDIVLPGSLGGPELVERVHERRPGFPVLFCTAYRDAHLDELPRGVPLLHKPFQCEELVRAVSRLLERAAPPPAALPRPR